MLLAIASLFVSIIVSSYGLKLGFQVYLNPVPGIIFGICLLLLFKYITGNTKKLWKNVFFVALSTAAYLIAVVTAIYYIGFINRHCDNLGPCDNQVRFALTLAGLVGGFLLASVGIKLLLKLGTWSQVVILTLISGFLGFLTSFGLGVNILMSLGLNGLPFFTLYLIWQIGMFITVWVCYKTAKIKVV